MIIFTSDPNLVLPYLKNLMVYNLSSYYSGYDNITNMITNIAPYNTTGMPINEYVYSPQFDIIYMNSVLNDPQLFNSFMKIMINSYEGYNVVVLVSHDDYRDAITESIIKMIQVRYGYNCWTVESLDDLECIKESSFTPTGLMTLDEDIKRFDIMCNSGNAQPVNKVINLE